MSSIFEQAAPGFLFLNIFFWEGAPAEKILKRKYSSGEGGRGFGMVSPHIDPSTVGLHPTGSALARRITPRGLRCIFLMHPQAHLPRMQQCPEVLRNRVGTGMEWEPTLDIKIFFEL